jgi:hypothetical protein
MGWENDIHGLLFKSSELKLYAPSHSYGMKISQIWRQTGVMRIMTYSLPSVDYVHKQIGRRPYDIWVLCHEKFRSRAQAIKNKFPGISICTLDNIHSKVILIEPKTLYIGSENFGHSGWIETCIGVRSAQAHDWFFDNVFKDAWARASVVERTEVD